mmetsp:Transcript_97605/g.260510  ORF Transcript_97605/g.260510 Transcript_97605/m.260510 type:complete len:278 (+) Transcript_97605:5680-6513(+)
MGINFADVQIILVALLVRLFCSLFFINIPIHVRSDCLTCFFLVVQITLTGIFVRVIAFTNRVEPLVIVFVVIVLVKHNSNLTSRIFDPPFLVLILQLFTKIGDLLRESKELSEKLLCNSSKHLLAILLSFRIENAVSLDRSKDLVSSPSQDVGRLVTKVTLQCCQQLLVDNGGCPCLGLVDLILSHIHREHSFSLRDIQLCLLLILSHGALLFSCALLFLQLEQLLWHFTTHHVSHFVDTCAPAQGLGLTSRSTWAWCATFSLQHQVRVVTVLEPSK